MKRTLFLSLFYFLGLVPASAQDARLIACETCGGSCVVGPVQTLYEPGWVVQVNTQYTHLGTGLEGSQVLPNAEHQRISSSITQLSAGYNFSEEFGLQLTLPYIDRSFRRTAGSQLESGTVSGLGDATLAARFTPISRFEPDSSLIWNFQVGLKR